MTERACAVLVGLDNPHSTGWLTTLQHCEAVGRLVVCADEEGEIEGVDQVYGDLGAVLAGEELDLALVCTRNDRAPGLAGQLLEAGVPLIVEKPVAPKAADIAQLNEIAAAKGLSWATAFMNRTHPIARKLRELVAEGVLGEIVSVEGRMVTSTVQQRNPQHWLFAQDVAGGGILHWLAIHTVDLIRYVSGLEFESVAAHAATLSGTGIDVEDVLAASFRMSNGGLGNIHAGYVLPRRYGDIFLCFRGSEGDATWVMWDFGGKGDRLMVQSRVKGWDEDEYREFNMSAGEAPGYGGALGLAFISDFLAASRGEGTFITDGNDALQAMRFVEAAYESAATGHFVAL
jgi:predicted dehydrogenase